MPIQPFESVSWSYSTQIRMLIRIYVHGWIAILFFGLVVYAFAQIAPYFDVFGNPILATVLAIVTFLIIPPLVGVLILYWLFPMLGRHEAWRGLTVWDHRLAEEIAKAHGRARIVIVNWPNETVRTIGVLTSKLEGERARFVAVYLPTAPQTRYGYIHIIPVEAVEMTDWTLRQWQLYQLSFGSVHPENQQSE